MSSAPAPHAMHARCAAFLVLFAVPAAADPLEKKEAFRFFSEERSASTMLKRVAPTQGSPVAVDVVTAGDIRASGAVNLWDLLRFRVGLDVVEGRSNDGSNRAVVSVRGIPRDGTHELLVLLDGRSVYDPLSGATLWERIPVQLQDIERIEIVRGPNAALSGSNAGLGVINIITRRPVASYAGAATIKGGTQRLGELAAAGEVAGKRAGLRLSAMSRTQGGAPTATDPSVQGHDFLHRHYGNLRGWASFGDARLELLSGISRQDYGKMSTNHPQDRDLSHFQMLRLDSPTGPDSSVELRVARNESLSGEYSSVTGVDKSSRFWQYDAEGFHTISWGEGRLQTTYGAAWRYAASASSYLYGATPLQTNRTVRGFLHQSIRILPTVSIMGGINHETANAGGYHKDFQGALMWSPVDEHSFRASYARANVKPQLLHRYADFYTSSGFVHIAGNQELKPSPLTNYEAGWMGLFRDQALKVELTGFYTEIRDHINLDQTAGPATVNYQYDNTNTVILRGFEAALRWRFAPGRSVYSNYTQETVADQDAHDVYVTCISAT